MSTTTYKARHYQYEEVIAELCSKARETSSASVEGRRDSDGTPLGLSLPVIHAKWLFRFQQDGFMPVSVEDAKIGSKVFDVREKYYKIKEHREPTKVYEGDFMSHYVPIRDPEV